MDRAFLELHDVLRERAGLAGKDVFDLTEVVRDTPVLGDAARVKGFVAHVEVLCEEVGLDRFDDFDRDEERYEGDVLQCDGAGAARSHQMGAGTTGGPDPHKGNGRIEDGRARRIYTRFIDLDARIRLTVQDTIDDRREHTDDEQKIRSTITLKLVSLAILVSGPVKATKPIVQAVLRTVQPRRRSSLIVTPSF